MSIKANEILKELLWVSGLIKAYKWTFFCCRSSSSTSSRRDEGSHLTSSLLLQVNMNLFTIHVRCTEPLSLFPKSWFGRDPIGNKDNKATFRIVTQKVFTIKAASFLWFCAFYTFCSLQNLAVPSTNLPPMCKDV